jgi:hypothetical protein
MDTRDNTPMDHKDRRDNDENIRKDLATHADDLGINETVSGDDRSEEVREQRRHHQEHGNRRYKMHSNHSSADDQPKTNTGI